MVGPAETKPVCVVYSLEGSDEGAEQVARGWFTRMAAASESSDSSAPTPQSKAFTVWLRPAFVEHPVVTPIDLPWADDALLASTVAGIVASLYAEDGYPRVWELRTSIGESSLRYERSLVSGKPDPQANLVPFASVDELGQARGAVIMAFGRALQGIEKQEHAAVAAVEDKAAEVAAGRLKEALDEVNREVDYIGTSAMGGRVLTSRGKAMVEAARDVQQRYAAVATATDLDTALTDLSLAMSVHFRTFPILHRVWRLEMPDETMAGTWAFYMQLMDEITRTVEGVRDSNEAFAAEIKSDHAMVWQYPPLVTAALDQLAYLEGSVEHRAAQDRLEVHEGQSLATTLSQLVGAAATYAWVTGGAAPPAELALASAGLVLGIVTGIEDFLERRRRERASMAVLDPSKALAADPGYFGVAVNLAFTLLDLNGVRGAVRAARGVPEGAEVVLEVVAP